MKKILSLVLSLTLIIILGSVCFAAQEDTTIKETEVPKASAESVDKSTYKTPPIKMDDELIPKGPSSASVEKLPKTGGIPAEAFYVAGVLFIAAALIISKKKVKVASKN